MIQKRQNMWDRGQMVTVIVILSMPNKNFTKRKQVSFSYMVQVDQHQNTANILTEILDLAGAISSH